MEKLKEKCSNGKSTIDINSLKRLVQFLHQFEEKLFSVKTIHENLFELIQILCETHQTIVDQFQLIQSFINQISLESQFPDDEEIIPIDGTKSEWDDDEDEQQQEIYSKKSNENCSSRKISPSTNRTDYSSINSASSCESSSTISSTIQIRLNSLKNPRLSNLKKLDQNSLRSKSPKSVSFILDNQSQQLPNDQTKDKLIKEIKIENERFHQITTPILPSSSNNLSEENCPEMSSSIKNCLTNIRIHEIEEINGQYLRLLNISNSDDYDLSEHFLQQNISSKLLCRFRFPSNTIIRTGQTVTVFCGNTKDIYPQPPHIFVWKEQQKWETGAQCVTILAKPNGQIIASSQTSNRIRPDCSSTDILYLHCKTHSVTNERTNSVKKRIRLSADPFSENHKAAFAHSPNNPIHPDHHETVYNLRNHFRSQMYQTKNVSQLLKRPKSSPFASHSGSKQDTIIKHFLNKKQTKPSQKSTTLQT